MNNREVIHEHISYEDCQKLRRLDFANLTSDEEEWFRNFDDRLDDCEECCARFDRFKELVALFPDEVEMTGTLTEESEEVEESETESEKAGIVETVRGMLDRCEASLKDKLSRWLNGTRSLLDAIPNESFRSSALSMAVRGSGANVTQTEGKKEDADAFRIYPMELKGIFELVVEGDKKQKYVFTVRRTGDEIPSILVISGTDHPAQLHELMAMPNGKYGKKPVELEPGDYTLYVLTLKADQTEDK